MAGPLGDIASIITISEAVIKLIKYRSAIKSAQDDRERYCNGLRAVAGLQASLDHILETSPHLCSLAVNIDGQDYGLVEYVNQHLSVVRNQAETLVQRFGRRAPEEQPRRRIDRMREWLETMWDSNRFVLAESEITSLVNAVESAHSCLRSAIVLVHVHSSESWQSHASDILADMREDMAEHGRVLRILSKQNQLEQAPIELRSSSPFRQTAGRSRFARKRMRLPNSRKGKGKYPARDQGENTSPVLHEAPFRTTKSPARAASPSTEPTVPGPSMPRNQDPTPNELTDDDMDDACDDNTDEDEDELPSVPTMDLDTTHPDASGPHDRSYDLIIRNGMLFQEVSKPQGELTLACRGSHLGVADTLDSMSDEEWDEVKDSEPERLVAYLSGPSTAYPSGAACGLSEHESDLSASDAETERPDNDSNHSSAGEAADESEHDPRFPINQSPVDNPEVFKLLRAIMLNDVSGFHQMIEWDIFVEYLLLARKYSRVLGSTPFQRAKVWVTNFLDRVPNEANEEAMLWLWIFWALDMREEFKRLSSTVQQNARGPLSQLRPSFHAALLPECVINALDQKRVLVLSRVRDMIWQEIKNTREWFAKAANDQVSHFTYTGSTMFGIMVSTLAFAYFTTESSIWLKAGPTDSGTTAFEGVSVSDLCSGIRTTMRLADFMFSVDRQTLLHPVDPVVSLVSALSVIWSHRPALKDIRNGILPDPHKRLRDLITILNNEEWGVDLEVFG